MMLLPRFRRLFWFSILIFSILSLAAFVYWVVPAVLHYPYQFGYGEPVLAEAVVRLPERPLLYKAFDEPPMTILPYHPLYFYVSYAASFFTGGNSFAAGRLVSFMSFLAILFLAYRILKREGVARVPACVFALMPAVVPLLTKYAGTMKMDLLGIAFTLAGVRRLIEWEKKRTEKPDRGYGFGVFYLMLSFWTKQSYLTAFISFAVFLLFRRGWKAPAFFTACFLVPVICTGALLNAATSGAYIANAFLANMLDFHGSLLAWSWGRFSTGLWPLYAAAFIALGARAVKRQPCFLDVYFVFAVLSTVSLGKTGSDDNYFIELTVAAVLAAGSFFSEDSKGKQVWMKALAGALLALQVFGYGKDGLLSGKFASMRGELETLKKQQDEISGLMRLAGGEILCENMGLLVANGRPITYQPFEFTQLADQGYWDASPILSKLKRRNFSMVLLNVNPMAVLRTQRFSEVFLVKLKENYRPYGVLHGHFVMVPREDAGRLSGK